MTLEDCAIGTQLLELRRDMAWRRSSLDGELHASTDAQGVRDEIFGLLQQADFLVDATILEKAKAQPQTRTTDERFYKYAWLYHFKYIAPKILDAKDELFLSAASVGTGAHGRTFREAIEDVVRQVSPALDHRVVWRRPAIPASRSPTTAPGRCSPSGSVVTTAASNSSRTR